jgi:addiction module HigA family antidote
MAMKNSPHPGRLLKDAIEALELTVAQAAKGLGVTRQQLHRVISGSCGISPEWRCGLKKVSGAAPARGLPCRQITILRNWASGWRGLPSHVSPQEPGSSRSGAGSCPNSDWPMKATTGRAG